MEFLMGTWGATYAVNVFSLSPADAAKWVSLFFGGIMLGRFVAGFASMKLNDNRMIKSGMIISFMGIIFLALPLGEAALYGFLLIGFGFGPIFPSILHSVPDRFGKEFSADITGFHMGGAYTIGFAIQMVFGFVASATTFKITPFVLLGVCGMMVLMNEMTLKKLKKSK
jgi:fucose permease